MAGAIASFVLALITALLVALGFWHAIRIPAEEILFAQATHSAVPIAA
jgi:hypothetical protein